jgi:ribulose-phosphate 3-epimerase
MSAIIPGILEQEWSAIEKKLELIRPFAQEVHIDLIDGVMAENRSFMDPEPFRRYAEDFTLEVHLMVDDPLQYVEPFAAAGFTRFIGHVELMPNQVEFVAEAEQYGVACLALDARTPMSEVHVPYADLDMLLIMTVNAGFSGQLLLPQSLEKVKHAVRKHPELLIGVDGGITWDSLMSAYAAGARRFVATSAIFAEPDPHRSYEQLSEIVAKMAEESVLPE